MFDQYATLAALEQGVNVAREKGDDRALKFKVHVYTEAMPPAM